MEQLLARASEEEKRYSWSGAIESLATARGLVEEDDFWRMGHIYERIGYAYYRFARQADSHDRFTERMADVSSSYREARSLYDRSNAPSKGARALRCDAFLALSHYWLSSDPLEKKRRLHESWQLALKALEDFKQTGENKDHRKTLTQLSLAGILARFSESSFVNCQEIVTNALEHVEYATRVLSDGEERDESARLYAASAVWQDNLRWFLDLDSQENNERIVRDYWQKARQQSDEAALVENSSLVMGLGPDREGPDKDLAELSRSLEYSRKTSDRLIIGSALNMLAYEVGWEAASIEDSDEAKEYVRRYLDLAKEAKAQYDPIGFVSPFYNPWPESPHALYYMVLAYYFEADPDKKREAIWKGLEACPEYVRKAEDWAFPMLLLQAYHTFGVLLVLATKTEPSQGKKKKLLTNALEQETRSLRLAEDFWPSNPWARSLTRSILADIKSQLAELSDDSETKSKLLEEAIREKQISVELGAKHVEFNERKGMHAQVSSVALWNYELGELLNRLFELTSGNDILRRAADAYREAGRLYQKLEMVSRIAECHWKTGRVYQRLDRQLEASEEFVHASESYRKAAEKFPRLDKFYKDYQAYMEAWSEIAKARYHHGKEEYGTANSNYEKAAKLHSSTSNWSYLASNYSAWAKLEEAEDLSRREHEEEARVWFNQAAGLFEATHGPLTKQLGLLKDRQERDMVSSLVKATEFWVRYCRARVTLEDARVLNKKGERLASSRKFADAAQNLEEMMKGSKEEHEEIKLIGTLARAWEEITRAEAEASPKLYLKASSLFEKAKDLSHNEKSKMLAFGHSRFSRALAGATRFVDTRETTAYVEAKEQLEIAADYYLKTGFPDASEYAKATKLLLDAYMFMVEAARSRDQEEKERLYTLTEKVLEGSAAAFQKARHSGKREEVRKLLEKVRGERELARSLAGLLRIPFTVSTTESFTVPRPTHEEAVGLERFEQADIRAELSVARRNLRVGERVEVGIDMVNAGRGLAQLVKIAQALPAGFELLEKPEKYIFKDGALEIRGKRIGPLKTEEIRMAIQPRAPGMSALCPEIRYLDEAGAYKTCRPEPVDIVVGEPYLPEWLKGPGPVRVPTSLRFETDRAKEVFQRLGLAFREDYVVKGLFADRAGWRSFMQLVRECKVPRSSFYGQVGRKGPVLSELERLGLVEVRAFTEERGRGGVVTKIRLAYDKVILKE